MGFNVICDEGSSVLGFLCVESGIPELLCFVFCKLRRNTDSIIEIIARYFLDLVSTST